MVKQNREHICMIPAKVAIVGAGSVGSTAAYAMMLDGAVSEIALIDRNTDKAEGEALDLRHGMQFTKSAKIWAGDSFDLVADAQIVVVCAGIPQKPGESRTALLKNNVAVFKEIIPQIVKYNKECILLVVSNPLDVLTYVAHKLSGFESGRVFGTGTVLDTARLRYMIGRYFNISPKDVVAHILGEHGDTEFAWWSGATIAGVPLTQLSRYSVGVCDKIEQEVKNAAYEIIKKKGATFYAIGLVIAKIVRAIIMDQSRVMAVSNVLHGYAGLDDVCLSVPTIIRKGGICERLPLFLNDDEQVLLEKTHKKVTESIEQAVTLL